MGYFVDKIGSRSCCTSADVDDSMVPSADMMVLVELKLKLFKIPLSSSLEYFKLPNGVTTNSKFKVAHNFNFWAQILSFCLV